MENVEYRTKLGEELEGEYTFRGQMATYHCVSPEIQNIMERYDALLYPDMCSRMNLSSEVGPSFLSLPT